MNKLKTLLKEFKDSGWLNEGKWWIEQRRFFQNFFLKENLEVLKFEDYQKMLNYIHSFNMAIIKKKVGNPENNSIDTIRNSLLYLIYGNDDLAIRINEFCYGTYKISFWGTSAISELVAQAFAGDYVLFNNRDKLAVEYLGIQLNLLRGDRLGEKFVKYNNAIKPIVEIYKEMVGLQIKDLTVPLELDQFFSWIYETKIGDQPKEENEVITNITEKKMDLMPKNIIFYGPPGTGKTYHCLELIKDLCGEDRDKYCRFITFHQSYSYEDFIEGIRPNLNSHELVYELKDGVFKEMCIRAKEDPGNNYFLIIDEINRGNLSKIFGELITLIEEDKRGKISVVLPYSRNSFTVPENLYIIGTMNTADRSIALIDIALRRRFIFEEILPDYALLKSGMKELELDKLLENINERIASLVDRDHMIGHSYFLKVKDLQTEEEKVNKLRDVWYYEIIPLMQEYFYNDWDNLEVVLSGKFIKSTSRDDIPAVKEICKYDGSELVVVLKSLYEE